MEELPQLLEQGSNTDIVLWEQLIQLVLHIPEGSS